MQLIGVTGYKRSGKGSIAAALAPLGFKEYGFADELRRMAAAINPIISIDKASHEDWQRCAQVLGRSSDIRYCDLLNEFGYEGAKAIPDFRLFLQRLGTEGIRESFGPNAWVNILQARLDREQPERAIITDVRFDSEALMVRFLKGKLWRVERPGCGGDDAHASERDIGKMLVDRVLSNSGSLEDLRQQAVAAYHQAF